MTDRSAAVGGTADTIRARNATVSRSAIRTAALVGGLGCALILRLALAGPAGDTSIPASLVFAACLLALTVATGWRPSRSRWQPIALGIAGAAAMCAIPALRLLSTPTYATASTSGFGGWALAVVLVASAEEVLFRGAIYSEIQGLQGDLTAVLVSATLFAAMHAALNGGHALLLDFAAGVMLGALRLVGGSVAAPATAHVIADLAAWWLR